MGDSAGIVGGEIDAHAVIHIEPFRVVVHFFDVHGGGGEEADGMREIGELVFAMKFGSFDGPAGEFVQSGLELERQ